MIKKSLFWIALFNNEKLTFLKTSSELENFAWYLYLLRNRSVYSHNFSMCILTKIKKATLTLVYLSTKLTNKDHFNWIRHTLQFTRQKMLQIMHHLRRTEGNSFYKQLHPYPRRNFECCSDVTQLWHRIPKTQIILTDIVIVIIHLISIHISHCRAIDNRFFVGSDRF